MSDFVQRLRRQAKELTTLERDLRVRPEESIDWQRTTMSSALAGLGNPVELAFLADYFLTTWTEWRGLFERYPRYFGRPEDSLPRQWYPLAQNCRLLADRLFREDSLGEVLAATWQEQEGESNGQPLPRPADDDDVALLYRSMVRNHLRLSALGARKSGQNGSNGAWSRCADVAHHIDARWRGWLLEASPSTRQAVFWHLRHYRHATLALSWLNGSPRSAFDQIFGDDHPMTVAIEGPVAAFHVDSENAQEVRRILARVTQAIGEIGYDNFLEDVTAKEFAGGPESPVGSSRVSIVPGPAKGNGSPILIGLPGATDAAPVLASRMSWIC